MNRTLMWIGAAAAVAALIIISTLLYLVLGRDKPAPAPAPAAQADADAPTLNLNKPTFPHMQLQAQYAGPLADTIVQRWRDPIDGTVCYLYLPIVVHHSKSKVPGYVEYGGNYVGSIACMPPQAKAAAVKSDEAKSAPAKTAPVKNDKKPKPDNESD